MKKLSQLNEGIFTSIGKKTIEDEERKEDEISTNIGELKTSAKFGSTYWANDLLIHDGENAIISISSFNKMHPNSLKGWRLPTKEDFFNMKENGNTFSISALDTYFFERPGRGGYYVNIISDIYYQIQPDEDGQNVIIMDSSNMFSLDRIAKDETLHDGLAVVVHLVRDNKLNEGIFTSIGKKTIEDEERKEDVAPKFTDKHELREYIESEIERQGKNVVIKNLDVSNFTDLSFVFNDFSDIKTLDLTGWKTDNVKSMWYMFQRCCNLESLNLSGWNTKKIQDTTCMFYGCKSLTSLDLSGWETDNIINCKNMFKDCPAPYKMIDNKIVNK